MEKLSFEQLKETEKKILDYVADVCEKNNLTYYLAYGTLLGAVRHKGFIPWDDDIDLFMPRADYMKFIDVVNNDGREGVNYNCFSVFGEGEYYYPFLKVSDNGTVVNPIALKPIEGLGVNVDIFVLDSFNGNKSLRRKIKRQFYKLQTSLSTKYIKSKSGFRDIFKRIYYLIYKNKNPKKYGMQIERLSQSCEEKTHKLFCGYADEVYKAEWFGEGVLLDFDGRKYRCPENYDAVLKTMYGDYMTLPPEEERVVPHGADAYKK